MFITSAQNSKVKLVNRLRGKRGRTAEMRFVIDYERDLRRAIQCGYKVDFILHCPEHSNFSVDHDCDIYQITPQMLKSLSYRENPDSIIAVMHSKAGRGVRELDAADAHQLIVLVDLRVPGNIGALLRSADATGIDAVILVDTALDLYNPNIIRSSTGACFLDNIFQLKSEEAINWLRRNEFQIVAADAGGANTTLDIDFQRKTAVALGTEDRGLDQNWTAAADQVARIPMDGRLTDSLNVSVSGAIFMYEMQRQRQPK